MYKKLTDIPLDKIWVFDAETDGLLAKVSKIHLMVFIRADRKKKRVFRADRGEIDKGYEFLLKILNSKDFYLSGHNISQYDLSVFKKFYNLDTLKYYKKCIDTLLLAQLKFPKFRVAQLPESNKLFDHEKESHSLDVWSRRIGRVTKDTDFDGLTEGVCIKSDRGHILNWIHSINKQATLYKGEIIAEKLSDSEIELIKGNYDVEVKEASDKQLKACKWTLVNYDRMLDYCITDVEANIDVLRFLLLRHKQDLPTLAVLHLEQYVAMFASIMTIYGQKIDREKMESIKSFNEAKITQIDVELSDSFIPYFKKQTQPNMIQDLVELSESYGSGLLRVIETKNYKLLDKMIFIYKNNKENTLNWVVGFPLHRPYNPNYMTPKDRVMYETKIGQIEGILKPYEGSRNSSKWVQVTPYSARSLLKRLVCSVTYYKNGKPKSKKLTTFKETEDGFFYKVPISTSKLLSKLELEEFKPNSRQSILKFLKRKYDIIPTFATDRGSYKLDAEWFESLEIPEAKPLAERFRCSKMVSECNTILDNLDENDIVHPTFNTNATNTSRMSSQNPSLQNINSDKEFRSCFIHHDHHKHFYSADLESAELFLLGHYLQPFDNGEFLEAVVNGKKEDKTDIHNVNARKAGVSRDEAKILVYSILYKASPLLVGYNLWNDDVAKRFIPTVSDEDYDEAYKYLSKKTKDIEGVDFIRVKKDYWTVFNSEIVYKYLYGKDMSDRFVNGFTGLKELEDHLANLYKTNGGITLPLGKVIWFKDERTALNYTLQGNNAYIIKLTCYFASELARKSKYKEWEDYSFMTVIHDEVNLSIKDKSISFTDDAMKYVNQTMKFKYPMGLDGFKFDNWSMH